MKPIRKREKIEAAKQQSQPNLSGRRMKNAFLRARAHKTAVEQTAKELDCATAPRQDAPNEYAEERVQEAAGILIHDAVGIAAAETGYAARQGRTLFQHRQKAKTVADRQPKSFYENPHLSPSQTGAVRKERPSPPMDEHLSERTRHNVISGERPLPQRVTTAEQRRIPRQGDGASRLGIEKPSAVQTNDILPANQMEARGRTLAKNQAAKQREVKRQKEGWGKHPSPPNLSKENQQVTPDLFRVNQTERTADEEKPSFAAELQLQKHTVHPAGVESPVLKGRKTIEKAPPGRTFAWRQRIRENLWRIERPTVSRSRSSVPQIIHKQTQAKRVSAQAMKRVSHVTAKPAAKIAAGVRKTFATASRSLLTGLVGCSGVLVAVVLLCLIGLIVGSGWGVFFSGEDGGTGRTMPVVIREIEQEYAERLAEIQATTLHDKLQISGSRAGWPDVLAVYAVKTTTDPANPQEVATIDDGKEALLREIFWAMNQIDFHTETRNISEEETETTLYITTASKTAEDMADEYAFDPEQQAQLSELLAPENRFLWNTLLYGISGGSEDMVAVALFQIGNAGGQPYWSWYGYGSRVEWCACFVSWCADQCGYLDSGMLPRFSNCMSGVRWFQDRGLWQDRSYAPNPGDIIFFDWDGDNLADHVGIVEKVENGTVYTIEGNSNDRVKNN